MKNILFPVAIASMVLGSAFAGLSPARAETIALKIELKASDEVPPDDSKGTGTVTATNDTARK